jgi:predicted glycoside hydrolase/deacetylase ChbG (UPF0249 family)
MAARLILNADDFGLTRGINRAIAQLHTAGALTSATLMANGPAFDDAVAITRAHPSLGVGCHIVLADGLPVSPPESIRTLLGPDQRTFRPRLSHFIRDLLLRRIDEADIEREALAQVRKLQQAGIRVTHLDTHKHTHIFPPVTRALVRVLHATGVLAVRNPFEPGHATSHAAPLRRLQIATLKRFSPSFNRITAAAPHPDATFGISATGSLNAATLQDILAHLPATGTFEILCHPGYNDADLDALPTRLRHHRETELQGLLTVLPQIRTHPNAPTLISYAALEPNP